MDDNKDIQLLFAGLFYAFFAVLACVGIVAVGFLFHIGWNLLDKI